MRAESFAVWIHASVSSRRLNSSSSDSLVLVCTHEAFDYVISRFTNPHHLQLLSFFD